MGKSRLICLLLISLALSGPAYAIYYVDAGAPEGGSGTSWAQAFDTIQEGVDAAHNAGGGEVWVKSGTYTGLGSEVVTDSFQFLSSDAVDILGAETDMSYDYDDSVSPPTIKNCHLTVTYCEDSPTQPPAQPVIFPDEGRELHFTERLASRVGTRTDLLVFANHPTKSGEVISREDLSAAANAGVLHAMEIILAGDVDKWDYVLGNLPDTDSTKILWGLRADDTHYAELVDFACWTGAMMGIIETAEACPDRREAFRRMVTNGRMLALPTNCTCEVPTYTMTPTAGTATNFRIDVRVNNPWGAERLKLVIYVYDSVNGKGKPLENERWWYFPQGGGSLDISESYDLPANPQDLKYLRPVLRWVKVPNQREAYLEPVRIMSDGSWWSSGTPPVPISPYVVTDDDTTVYFNTHAHSSATDGTAAPPTMRKRYWDDYGLIDPNKPRFGILTDHNTATLFSPPTKSVVALKEGVHVYGGFAGAETLRSQRNWTTNVTTIDAGDAGRCVYAKGIANATLDGFTIQKGRAANGCGGGMYCLESSPAVANCTFTENAASFGAGMCITSGHPTVTNCAFTSNFVTKFVYETNLRYTTYGSGGGIFSDFDLANQPGASITKCSFADNWASGNTGIQGRECPLRGRGGGMEVDSSSPTVANCVFKDNRANGTSYSCAGGGVCVRSAKPSITNCTFVGNQATRWHYGGGIYCGGDALLFPCGGQVTSDGGPTLRNNIIVSGDQGVYRYSGTPVLEYNDVYDNPYGNYYNVSPDPGSISEPALFVDKNAGDFHLKPNSPCIDAGTNTDAPVTDNEGYSRPQDGNADRTLICDMGAYEYPLSAGIVKSAYEDDIEVAFGGVSVTGSFPSESRTYVENLARNAGIRLQTSQSFDLGDALNLSGTMQTDSSTGERYVQLSGSPQVVCKGQLVTPLSLINRSVGGAAVGYQPGVTGSVDLNNVDLRVTLWGNVARVDSESFYVDDGSALDDGSGYTGVRVVWTDPNDPLDGDYVVVTGISSLYKNTEMELRPVIRATDVVKPQEGLQGRGMAPGPEGGFAPGPESSGQESFGPEEGSIEYALAQPDGSHVSVRAVQIASHDTGSFILREIVDPANHPTVLVESGKSVSNLWVVDVEGIIFTRSSGERAIDDLQVLLYTDSQGRPAPPSPMISVTRGADWLWKLALP